MSADKLPHCPDCGYTEQDASIHMDHYRCEARGGAIPRIRWQDHVELQRRMDAVRAYCEQVADAADSAMEREGNTKIPLTALREHMRRIQARLDGEAA